MNRDSPELSGMIIEKLFERFHGETSDQYRSPKTAVEPQAYEELMETYDRDGPGGNGPAEGAGPSCPSACEAGSSTIP